MFYNHLAVQAQDVLEYPRRPVKVELPPLQRVRVAQAEYLRCDKQHQLASYYITSGTGTCGWLHCVTRTKFIELTR